MGVLVDGAVAAQVQCDWRDCEFPLAAAPPLLFAERGSVPGKDGRRNFPGRRARSRWELTPLWPAGCFLICGMSHRRDRLRHSWRQPGSWAWNAPDCTRFTPNWRSISLRTKAAMVRGRWSSRCGNGRNDISSLVLDVAAPGNTGTVKGFLRPEQNGRLPGMMLRNSCWPRHQGRLGSYQAQARRPRLGRLPGRLGRDLPPVQSRPGTVLPEPDPYLQLTGQAPWRRHLRWLFRQHRCR